MGSVRKRVRSPKTMRGSVANGHEVSPAGQSSQAAGELRTEQTVEETHGREALELRALTGDSPAILNAPAPDRDSLGDTGTMANRRPLPSVIIITVPESAEWLRKVLNAAAADRLLEDATSNELSAAPRRVLSDESVADGGLAARLLEHAASEAARPPERPRPTLSQREQEVLSLLAEGYTNREIAAALWVSPGTAKVHVKHILTKLGVSSRTQAAVRALGWGLL